jgi:pyridoxamine 5'-phosphate oxidase
MFLMSQPSDMRREYAMSGLREVDADPDPIRQFGKWFTEAVGASAGDDDPNAMTLATATRDGIPSARIVLLKGFDASGFAFFTNYDGAKARELAANPQAALCFWWHRLERQVRITGTVSKVSRSESESYFAQRPRGSQLGAWVSHQSQVVSSRQVLEDELARLEKMHDGKPVPTPPNWGGYRLKPQTIEFWQGRPNRLHDRLRYRREDDAWKIERLSP